MAILFFSCNPPIPGELRPKIKDWAHEIAKRQILTTAEISKSFSNESYSYFRKIQKMANEEELILLTEYKNPIVKCYAFQELANRNSSQTFSILIKNLNNKKRFELLQGIIYKENKTVRDYFLDVVNPDVIPYTNYVLTQREQEELDSLLLVNKRL